MLCCLVVALLVWLSPVGDARADNPDIRWRTLETEHFYVHYWGGNEEAAERTALIAERAYSELTMAWGHRVFLKTHVVLSDVQDTANGSATTAPFPRVTAYTTAPNSLSVLETYDDWLDILITHELVHIVHLDTVHGLYRLANAVLGFGVLGKVTQPNILQPRWVVEGVATMQESEYTSAGRRRSAQFDAFMRMSVLDQSFQTIDQISSGARIYPHGTSVYLYGLHFMFYIRARYGQDKLAELSHLYATQVIPYGLNKAIERILGVTFYELWEEWKADTTRKFEAQARRIRNRGLRQGRRLTFAGEESRYPVWSADDEYIYFYGNDGHREEGLKRIKATGGRVREGVGIGRQGVDVDVEHVIDMETPGEASFVGATGDMIYEQIGVYDFRYRWSDLWRWNGGDPKQAEQITFGQRAFEPHVSPDGHTVVFRRNDTAQSRLAFVDLDTGDITEAPPMERLGQVYTPRWNPDGKRIAFSAWRTGGYRDIYVYDRDSGDVEPITQDRHMDMAPTWSPDGRYLLFTSDRDNVYNIYAYDTVTERLRQVSNVLGGAFEPAVSHDGEKIAYIGFGKAAYDVWVMEFDPDSWLEVAPSMAEMPLARDSKPELKGQGGRPLSLGSRRYRPIETLYPRTVFPTALDFQSGAFGTGLGFQTGLADVLGWHILFGNFNYLMDQRVATGSASYTYTRLWPNFNFFLGRGFRNAGGFQRFQYDRDPDEPSYLVERYRERTTTFSGSVSLPVIRHPRHRADFAVGYAWTRWENLDEDDLQIDPNAPISGAPEVGDATDIDLRASYSNEQDGGGRFHYGVERGRSAAVRVEVFDERLGGDFGAVTVTGSYRETIEMPWRGHQSLQLSLRGGAAAGDFRVRGRYCVGDYASTLQTDVVRTLLQRGSFSAGGCTLLRGHDSRRDGQFMGDFTAEYRIPLVDVDRGLGTLPVFFQRIGMIPFVDVGNAWTEPDEFRDLLVAIGATLVFSLRMGYGEGVNLLFQYAHGFDDELGVDSFRTIVSTTF